MFLIIYNILAFRKIKKIDENLYEKIVHQMQILIHILYYISNLSFLKISSLRLGMLYMFHLLLK